MKNDANKPSRGGYRPGAGRKPNSSEKTTPVRVPISMKPALLNFLQAQKDGIKLPQTPYFRASLDPVDLSLPLASFKLLAGATTGFASPALDYESEGDELDINKHLVTNPASTYIFPVGKDYDSMIDAGIMPGCYVIVDRTISVRHNSIVVAAVDNEWVVKRLYRRAGVVKLLSENRVKNYSPIEFKEGQQFDIFGVVKHAINNIT